MPFNETAEMTMPTDENNVIKSYTESLTALVTFVADIAKKEALTDQDKAQRNKAKELVGDFIVASLFKLAEQNTKKD